MYILGIGGFYHDAAACLIKDGEIVAVAEEERFNRKKHSSGVPVNAIEFCLKKASINISQVDHVAYYFNKWGIFLNSIKDAFLLRRRVLDALKVPAFNLYMMASLEVDKIKASDKLGFPFPKMVYIDHHQAHAASAYFVSPYDNAAILILDLMGESASTSLLIGKGNQISKLKEIKYPHSIGLLYASITDYLGFKVCNDEYKVMGLASFGDMSLYDEFRKIVRLKPGGEYEIDLKYFTFHKTGRSIRSVSELFISKYGLPRKHGEIITQHHKNIAAALQKLTEEIVLNLTEYLYRTVNVDNLCIAGGVGLNSVANGRILKQGLFKNIYIQPSSHDAGCAIGCAYYVYNQMQGNKKKFIMEHDYYGPEYTDKQIEAVLHNSKVNYKYCDEIEKETAKLLAAGKIIGWFQGRMEFGPRALGNRSILADPTRADMMDIINKWVKHREDFRPFAPAIMEEEAKDYFDISCSSPFMLFVVPVKKNMRKKIPAVTHVDGTARVQTVSKKNNPKFWGLISEFKKITGVPVVLNTSFNVMGEPIVCTPADALRCFFSTGIDYLVMDNYLISK